ncbi:MAG: VOC family protein [Ardenticatenales bacterium]|nr:VOC family protein [Ardenticatenales bacterium]
MEEDRIDANGHASSSVPRAVGYVALWTDNPEALREFFTQMFHYEIIYEDHSVIVFDMEGETDLIIQRVDEETQHLNGTTRFGIYGDSLVQLTKTLKERGVSLAEELVELGDDQLLTVINTPTGHQIELVGSAALGLAGDQWDEEP